MTTESDRLAKAATPGPWRECGHDRGGCQCAQVWSLRYDGLIAKALCRDDEVTEGEGCTKEQAQANAAFIAYHSPAYILDLNDRHQAALDALAEIADYVSRGFVRGGPMMPPPAREQIGNMARKGLAGEESGMAERLTAAEAENESLRTREERERMCHAACGVAALGGSVEGVKDEYLSASVQDVVALRAEVERGRAVVEAARDDPEPCYVCGPPDPDDCAHHSPRCQLWAAWRKRQDALAAYDAGGAE